MKVRLMNSEGEQKRVEVGFSWTTFFFGFIPALVRGDLKWASVLFISAVIVGVFTLGFGAWLPGILFSFTYNKIYIKDLIDKGYKPANDADRDALERRGVFVKERDYVDQ
ncbi:DUF2628 domain-containing protein [Pullulanibacillus sp. KACC 23026]|uniref:DUF2628 domain-containing protein n=1 Tax=Pullulanibacillus sp. KACC 23026 TaxID=3028315 RepID=UPI0023B1531C|nr:DUF2628 domain-containing protein [Pullulanibacillus sp. KACC 23026]WEG13564.1 DUF2628 domain-containing protein [Pullulanibacillus sp. KACC 23026]